MDKDLGTFLSPVSLNLVLHLDFSFAGMLANTEDFTFLLCLILHSQNVLHSANVLAY